MRLFIYILICIPLGELLAAEKDVFYSFVYGRGSDSRFSFDIDKNLMF